MNPILLAILALLGWLIVPRITHALATCRERDTRKREFLAFLNKWRLEVSSCPERVSIGVGPVQARYKPKLPEFNAARTIVQDALADRQTFTRLADRLGSFDKRDCKDKKARDEILKAMDDLIQFVENNPNNPAAELGEDHKRG
jgi:hypothetical protein